MQDYEAKYKKRKEAFDEELKAFYDSMTKKERELFEERKKQKKEEKKARKEKRAKKKVS